MDRKRKVMRLKAEGIDCSACASDMEDILAETVGIEDASVNYPDDTVVVTYDPDVIERKDVYRVVRKLGYSLTIVSES